MKRKFIVLCITLLLAVVTVSGCSKADQQPENSENYVEESRTVEYDELGLRYTTPDLWRKYEKTNIYPITVSSDGTFAQIKYHYATEEQLKEMNENISDNSLTSSLKVICEIVVLEKSNLETVGVQSLFSSYNSVEQVGEEGDYIYYVISDYNGDLTSLTAEQLTVYNELLSAVPELSKTVSTYPFDPSVLKEATENMNNTITFSTETLDDKKIDSTIFADYKITMLNFGATYAHDESAVLQELYALMKNRKDVHLLTAYIDTPEVSTNKSGIELRAAAEAQYPTLVLDTTLANWVTSSLQGVPTTVFVDSNGRTVGEQIQGAKTADEYILAIDKAIEQVNNN